MTPLARALAVLLAAASAAHAGGFCALSEEDSVRRIVSCRNQISLADCRAVAEEHGCTVVRELPFINAVVIKVSRRRAAIEDAKMAREERIERVDEDKKLRWLKAADFPVAIVVPRFEKGKPEAAEPPELAEQPWGVRRLRAAAAWKRATGRGVKVAVIDTGIDGTHPDLAGSVAGGFNALDPSKPPLDDEGHGTHVAGTIAARRDGKGVVGVAPEATLYAVKVLDAAGNGSYSDIIAGLEWAAKNKMDVANLSLGAPEGSEALHRAVIAAEKAGVVVVAAAGNEDGGPVSFPGAYPETIAVSASTAKDGFASFSSKGAEVAVIAPGDDIKSTVPGGSYAEMSGTSMAAPHVAGLAALAIESGARGRAAILSRLQSSATFLPGLSADQQGRGLPDASRMLDFPVAVATAR